MNTFTRGFLPEEDPLERLPDAFEPWEEAAKTLPKLLVSDQLRSRLIKLPPFPVALLQDVRELNRAMQLLSYLGHAFVWGEREPVQVLPKELAVVWHEVGLKLGRPPVLSYASYALDNWKRLDPHREIELGNLTLIQNFLGGIDEEWFILVHVAIEAKAVRAVHHSIEAITAVQHGDEEALFSILKALRQSLDEMCKTLARMPEHCDPYIYYTRVRPYIHGWKNHPTFASGLIYEQVKEYGGKPQQFRGETGAQSAIIPMLDGLLGITHAQDELYHFLQEMRLYMPPKHRAFVRFVEEHSIRDFVKNRPLLREPYNSCIDSIDRFRTTHLGYAHSYIQKQHEKSEKNPTAIGTGGTPFMPYLQKHKDETRTFKL